jgi:hypothetical protein
MSTTIPYVSGNTTFYSSNYTGAGSPANVTLGTGWKSIGQQAFQSATSLTSITIPSGVTVIDSNAFVFATSLTSVIFEVGSQLTSIGDSAFRGASALTSIAIPSGVTSIGVQTFQDVTSLTSVIFEAGSKLTRIGAYGFYGASKLTSVIIPSNVTTIETSAFTGASKLASVIFEAGSKLTSIEAEAFQQASMLTSIIIPSGVTSIGNSAFSSSGLTQATINTARLGVTNFPTALGANKTIGGKSGVTILALPYEFSGPGTGELTQSVVTNANLASNNISNVVISGYTRIGNAAFQNASSLTSITIPSTVTSIGVYSFQSASSLTSITIPSTVTSIGTYAFYGVSALTSVIFEAGSKLTDIENQVFQNASKLTSITIPAGVTNIGDNAFRGTGLTFITIPSTVTRIGTYAFLNSGLTTAFFESASTVNALSLPSGDLINGYTVSSFYGKSSVTLRYTEAVRAAIAAALAARAAAPSAVISNSTFTSLLTEMAVNISNMTSEIITLTNDPYVEYSAKLTIPNGDLSTLSSIKKSNIINTVKALYAAQLSVNVNKIIVTLQSGSIIVNVNVLNAGITESMVPICFPKGTPVTTNQGVVAIEQLNTDIHTIRGKKIVAITQSRPLHKYIISIEKDALGKNVPSASIQISKEHKVFYKGEMVKANQLVEMCEGVTRIPYSGETLYNVLMEKHDNMMINNVICETLDPKNIMAKICGGKYNWAEQDKICKELNDIIKTDNVPAYKKLYASLK